MARKRSRKAISTTETIHFRPGRDLGEKIDQLANELMLSRGEAAKRVVSLAIREMDLADYYPLASRLVELEYNGITFEDACHRLHVAIVQEETEHRKGGRGSSFGSEDRLEAARKVIRGYELMRGLEEDSERQELKIQLFRTDSPRSQ